MALYTQEIPKESMGGNTLATYAPLHRVQYDDRFIEKTFCQWGGMEFFTSFSPSWTKGVGNSYIFRFKDASTIEEVEIVQFVTDAVDENGCPIQEYGDCPTRVCTPSSYSTCEFKLDTTFQVGVEYCYATDGLFSTSMIQQEYEDKVKQARYALHYSLWVALMTVATSADAYVPMTPQPFATHYWVTTDPLYDALLCVVTYLQEQFCDEWDRFVMFIPAKVQKKLLQDERFTCECLGNNVMDRFFTEARLGDAGQKAVYDNFLGLPIYLISAGIVAPGGNPFCPDADTARVLIAHPDAFVWHTEQLLSADVCKTEDYKEKMNDMFIAGCKVLRPDLLFVLEFTCE